MHIYVCAQKGGAGREGSKVFNSCLFEKLHRSNRDGSVTLSQSVKMLNEHGFFSYSCICSCELSAKRGLENFLLFSFFCIFFPQILMLMAVHSGEHKCGIALME